MPLVTLEFQPQALYGEDLMLAMFSLFFFPFSLMPPYPFLRHALTLRLFPPPSLPQGIKRPYASWHLIIFHVQSKGAFFTGTPNARAGYPAHGQLLSLGAKMASSHPSTRRIQTRTPPASFPFVSPICSTSPILKICRSKLSPSYCSCLIP